MTGCFAGNLISGTAKYSLAWKENGSSFVLNATVQVIGTERTEVHFRSIVMSFLFVYDYNIKHFNVKKIWHSWSYIEYYFILIHVPCIFYYFVQWPTNAQLIEKLSNSSYMFRHYCVIFREFIVSALPGYTSVSNVTVGNTI